ncbi:hypothetical protein AHAS_Ahas19G0293600 [Arachis hypogaea]
MEPQVCIAIERKSATLRENQLERGRGIVYHELLRRTPPLEPSFRCCPLALSRSIVAASVVVVAARFSRTSLVW